MRGHMALSWREKVNEQRKGRAIGGETCCWVQGGPQRTFPKPFYNSAASLKVAAESGSVRSLAWKQDKEKQKAGTEYFIALKWRNDVQSKVNN